MNPPQVARYERVKRMRERGMTLEQIGDIEGVTRERIRQIIKKPPRPPKPNRSDRLEFIDVLSLLKHAETVHVLFDYLVIREVEPPPAPPPIPARAPDTERLLDAIRYVYSVEPGTSLSRIKIEVHRVSGVPLTGVPRA